MAVQADVIAFDEAGSSVALEWLHLLHAQAIRDPPKELFSLFQSSTTVLIVNQANAFCQAAFSSDGGSTYMSCPIYLYYRALHLLLMEGQDGGCSRPDPAFLSAVVSSTSRQIALLAASAELVLFAATGKRAFPALTARLEAMDSLMDLWHLLPYLQQAATQVKEAPLPPVADAYMGYMRLRITEELAWMRGSPLYALLTPPNSAAGDDSLQSNLVQEFLLAAAELAMTRAECAARALADRIEELAIHATFECIGTVEAMMAEHLDLLFEQHLSRLVACCVYGTTRKHNVVVSIKRLNQAVGSVSPHLAPEALQSDSSAARNPANAPLANVRRLYNEVFLPRMRQHLQAGVSSGPSASQKPEALKKVSRLPLHSLSAKDINIRRQVGTPTRAAAFR